MFVRTSHDYIDLKIGNAKYSFIEYDIASIHPLEEFRNEYTESVDVGTILARIPYNVLATLGLVLSNTEHRPSNPTASALSYNALMKAIEDTDKSRITYEQIKRDNKIFDSLYFDFGTLKKARITILSNGYITMIHKVTNKYDEFDNIIKQDEHLTEYTSFELTEKYANTHLDKLSITETYKSPDNGHNHKTYSRCSSFFNARKNIFKFISVEFNNEYTDNNVSYTTIAGVNNIKDQKCFRLELIPVGKLGSDLEPYYVNPYTVEYNSMKVGVPNIDYIQRYMFDDITGKPTNINYEIENFKKYRSIIY